MCRRAADAVAELPKLKVNARQAARITNGVRTTVAQTATQIRSAGAGG